MKPCVGKVRYLMSLADAEQKVRATPVTSPAGSTAQKPGEASRTASRTAVKAEPVDKPAASPSDPAAAASIPAKVGHLLFAHIQLKYA